MIKFDYYLFFIFDYHDNTFAKRQQLKRKHTHTLFAQRSRTHTHTAHSTQNEYVFSTTRCCCFFHIFSQEEHDIFEGGMVRHLV